MKKWIFCLSFLFVSSLGYAQIRTVNFKIINQTGHRIFFSPYKDTRDGTCVLVKDQTEVQCSTDADGSIKSGGIFTIYNTQNGTPGPILVVASPPSGKINFWVMNYDPTGIQADILSSTSTPLSEWKEDQQLASIVLKNGPKNLVQ